MLYNIIKSIAKLFKYNYEKKYSFILSESQDIQEKNNTEIDSSNNSFPYIENKAIKKQTVYSSIDVNLEYLKVKYSALINSDIVIRRFNLLARGKEYSAFLIYIDGMINSTMINDFILKPLMMRNQSNTFEKADDSIPIAVSRKYNSAKEKKI